MTTASTLAAREFPVQRSASDHPARTANDRSGRPAGSATGQPAAAQAAARLTYVDAGAVAVAHGLAQREPDGSVVFGGREPVQRQEANEPAVATAPADVSGPADGALADGTLAGAAPGPAAMSAATAATWAAAGATAGSQPGAAAATGAAGPPLDELARQLFGPLAARLKAELRLDRERAGLLTDLR